VRFPPIFNSSFLKNSELEKQPKNRHGYSLAALVETLLGVNKPVFCREASTTASLFNFEAKEVPMATPSPQKLPDHDAKR